MPCGYSRLTIELPGLPSFVVVAVHAVHGLRFSSQHSYHSTRRFIRAVSATVNVMSGWPWTRDPSSPTIFIKTIERHTPLG